MRSVALAMMLALSGAAVAQEAPPRPGAPGHKSPRREPGYVTYVGFQKLADAPRVFVRVSSPVQPTQTVAGNEVVVTLPGFKLDMANNGRPLDTRWFGTPVSRVRAVEVTGKGVDVHVTFADGASPREARVSTAPAEEADAGSYVYLDF
jgi:hypothetical protein